MRIRVTFAKSEPMRFTSHLDLYRAWERLLRRAGLPLIFSQGYNPRPRLQLAAPLPLGITSQCEIIDFWISNGQGTLEAINSLLIQARPPGIEILEVKTIPADSPPLQKKVIEAEYLVDIFEPVPTLNQKIKSLLEAKTIVRQKRGKSYDLRPLIKELTFLSEGDNSSTKISMCLKAREGSTGRPEEVLLALGIQPEDTRIERTGLIFKE